MKKLFALCLFTLIIFGLAACGDNSTTGSEPEVVLKGADIANLHQDPASFKGKKIEISGKVFGPLETSGDTTAFQFFADKDFNNNTIAYTNESLDLKDGDFVTVVGTVGDVFKGQNALGGQVTAPTIQVDDVKKVTYVEAFSPTLREVPINAASEQHGITITLDKVEFAEDETRCYVTLTNNSADNFSIYSNMAQLIQSGAQYEAIYNFDANYPDFPTAGIVPGVTSSAIIPFDPIPQESFDLVLEGHSDDFMIDIQPFVLTATIE